MTTSGGSGLRLNAATGAGGWMSNYDQIGLWMDETMAGWLGVGRADPVDGRMQGELQGTRFLLHVRIHIDSLSRFLERPDHAARLEGTIDFAPLGQAMPIEHGVFNVFTIDPRSGQRQMVYEVQFRSAQGELYFLRGVKRVVDDTGFDVLSDMTTLFVTVFHGADEQGALYAAGQLYFNLMDAPKLLSTLKVTGGAWWGRALAAKVAFLSFIFGGVRDAYLADINPLYDAAYQNVVLSGRAWDAAGGAHTLFLVSGVHSKNFPWGDDESFSDVLLVLDPGTPGVRRFAFTDRVLEDHEVDVPRGVLRYEGPLFEIGERSTSFSELHGNAPPSPVGTAKIEVRFESTPHPVTPIPFRILGDVLDKLSYRVRESLRRLLPSEQLLGIGFVLHAVTSATGTLRVDSVTNLTLDPACTWGEAEDTTIRNVREPTLLYGYLCAIRQSLRSARVQFHSATLRNERTYWGKDRVDALLGAVVSHFASFEFEIQQSGLAVKDLAAPDATGGPVPLLQKVGPPLLEVNNDHYPTAVFQRRIVQVLDPSGETCLALEEDMDTLRRESINCDREAVVAAIHGQDKLLALHEALVKSGFWSCLDAKQLASGKSKRDFHIVIKPNFMFAYNKRDRSTYTDPELVGSLVERLIQQGYRTISVVEAQSTYGEYFDNRGVRDVAAYLGYCVDGSAGYSLVDLTEDAQSPEHLGAHLGFHPVPDTWRDADFRISFAKNKTHTYAFYTLTLKNIYGALSLPNKFKEYHCDRDIYHTTVDYLRRFPVHFGIVDGWLSADGPFGIFADAEPNPTHTILAGPDLVAVDWVGASKMGLDPKVSQYMQLALRAFGKPRIRLVGNPNPYRGWLNVPVGLSLFAHFGLDSNYHFGNLVYMAGAYMDENQFHFKERSEFMRAARSALRPIQESVFLQSGGQRSRANRSLAKVFAWLATEPAAAGPAT